MRRYENIDNTSPEQNFLKNKPLNVPRSAHDLSKTVIGQINEGQLIPIDHIRVYPNWTTNLKSYIVNLMTRNPMARKILSSYKVYLHAWAVYDRHIWEGAKNSVFGGRTGQVKPNKPSYAVSVTDPNKTGPKFGFCTPGSIADWYGVPPVYYHSQNGNSMNKPMLPDGTTIRNDLQYTPIKFGSGVTPNADCHTDITGYTVGRRPYAFYKISALPFAGYEKIFRDGYLNANLVQDNKYYFPDNDDDFILPFNPTTDVNCLNKTKCWYDKTDLDSLNLSANGPCSVPSNANDGTSIPLLGMMHYRNRKGDYFNTCSPFADLIRGTAPVLNLDLKSEVYGSNRTPVIAGTQSAWPGNALVAQLTSGALSNIRQESAGESGNPMNLGINLKDIKANLSLKSLRQLIINTEFLERNAFTDGSYDSMIKEQFGYKPHTDERRPIYIGGCAGSLIFNEISQTSGVTGTGVDHGRSLGDSVSKGNCTIGGNLGTFHADDFGYIHVMLSVVPDNFYYQGLSRDLTDLSADDIAFPINDGLSPEPILKRELYVSGTQAVDNDIFGYTERSERFRSRQNSLHGLSRCPDKFVYDGAIVTRNKFTSSPSFTNHFITLCPDMIDKSVFQSVSEPEFDVVAFCGVEQISSIPADSVPAEII